MDYRLIEAAMEAYPQVRRITGITRTEFNQAFYDSDRAKVLSPSAPKDELVAQIMEMAFEYCAGTGI